MQILTPGDHVAVARFGYTHHGIYAGRGEVIHYSGPMSHAVIEKSSYVAFADGGQPYLVYSPPDHPQSDEWFRECYFKIPIAQRVALLNAFIQGGHWEGVALVSSWERSLGELERWSGKVFRTDRRFCRGEVLQRAESRLGERKYDLLDNNCEHFANYCTGRVVLEDQASRLRRGLHVGAHAGVHLAARAVLGSVLGPLAAQFLLYD